MNISAKTKLCIIIGDPVEHSLSPAMHNAAYAALGIDDEFVYVAARVDVKDIQDVVRAVRVMGIRGLTCTIPHKMAVMQYLDEIDPIAQKIGAVNTVVNDNRKLIGYNTDWQGTVIPLEKVLLLKGRKVALFGAGGAARAMAYGVLERGARLTIFNRTIEKAQKLVAELSPHGEVRYEMTPKYSLDDFDIILNATSLGMGEQVNETPVPKEFIQKNHIVFDAVYSPYETRLLREAKEQGATVIHGTEMLLHQGMAQFELYTGRKAPEVVMREIIMRNGK